MSLPLDLTGSQAVAMAAAVLVAAFVRGYSGFGFSALTIAFAALIADPRAVMQVVFFCELGMTLLQARGVLRLIDWRRVVVMLAGAVVVMPFSVALLARMGLDTARLAISGMILLMCGVL
ncbi:MAG: sulfite exporter TauE/SafE family protein, partial [Paracoccaceae bacterium]|nr:sulfite exporter TauE/SafE family protein [Paracoccaceae bacterium]